MNEPNNPYASPTYPSGHENLEGELDLSAGPIISKFDFTIEHILESQNKFKQQSKPENVWRVIRIIVGSFFLLLMLALIAGVLGAGDTIYPLPILFIFSLLGVYLIVPEPIQRLLLRWRIRNHPDTGLDQEFHFLEDSIFTISRRGETRYYWSSHHSATIFNDGVLIFQNKTAFYWIPDRTLTSPQAATQLRLLCQKKLNTKTITASTSNEQYD